MAEPLQISVGDRTVRVSNPDKVYFPARGITKRQIVEFYLSVRSRCSTCCTTARPRSNGSPTA